MSEEQIIDVQSEEVVETPEEEIEEEVDVRPIGEQIRELRQLKKQIKKSIRYRKSNIFAIKQLDNKI